MDCLNRVYNLQYDFCTAYYIILLNLASITDWAAHLLSMMTEKIGLCFVSSQLNSLSTFQKDAIHPGHQLICNSPAGDLIVAVKTFILRTDANQVSLLKTQKTKFVNSCELFE